jgi:hypothetical protein
VKVSYLAIRQVGSMAVSLVMKHGNAKKKNAKIVKKDYW